MSLRPPKPVKPGPGQESVWDYPRPPALVPFRGSVRIEHGGVVVAESTTAYRVLETSHPPTFYIPGSAFVDGVLVPVEGGSFCEWKGRAAYADIVTAAAGGDGAVARRAAWTYPDPTPGFRDLLDHWSVMPLSVDAIYVDDERVRPQEGGFYGGWVTDDVVGPFKGTPGSWGW